MLLKYILIFAFLAKKRAKVMILGKFFLTSNLRCYYMLNRRKVSNKKDNPILALHFLLYLKIKKIYICIYLFLRLWQTNE